MEYKVIGWTHYDDASYPQVDEDEVYALLPVVAEAIRKGGYRFGGDAHNDRVGCTPVLNSGEKYCIPSFRQWGAVMAEAWGESLERFSYMRYYVDSLIESTVYPDIGVDESLIVDKSVLSLPLPEKKEPAVKEPMVIDADDCAAFALRFKKTIVISAPYLSGCGALAEMKLDGEYFDMIAEGKKTVELRLFDRKRRGISVGDCVKFVRRGNESAYLYTRVEKLYISSSFSELLFDPEVLKKSGLWRLGALGAEELMESFYSKEEQNEFGVVGIEVTVIKDFAP